MLNPNNDRLDYGTMLVPKPGYHLDFAVGTTYSMNLDALVGVSLALGLSEETDSELMNNPVCLLEALRSTGDKIALFCEGGQIHLPREANPLYILLEKMVFTVKTPKHHKLASFPSFHPKFWLIRYINDEGDIYYRVVVLSRNLTFDHNWDVSFYMDGRKVADKTDKNEPVCDFLRFLLRSIPDDENGKYKKNCVLELIEDLSHVLFEPDERQFIDYEFIPNGVKDSHGEYYSFDQTDLFRNTFREILIISPFVSPTILRSFNDRNIGYGIKNDRYMLFTREHELRLLKDEDVSRFELYILKDKVIDGETELSEDNTSALRQDIHAKVFMVRKYSETDLYLGSLNASRNAVYGNVEFMIRLRAQNRHLNIDKLSTSLFCGPEDGDDNPFQRVTLKDALPPEEEDDTHALDSVVKDINRSDPTAYATQEDEEHYSIDVHFVHVDTKEYQVTVKPLLSVNRAPFSENVHFSELSITHLSEFYVISVTDGEKSIERVLIIRTKGLPEDREKSVVTSIVSNRECFYRYIAFLLGDDSVLSMLEGKDFGSQSESGNAGNGFQIPALYEKMLKTAATNPDKFKGIEYLMKAVSEDGIIPEDFMKLYLTFKKAVKLDD